MHNQANLPYDSNSPKNQETTEHDRLNLLALSSNNGVGFRTILHLYRAFPDLSMVWETDPEELAQKLSRRGFSFPRTKAARFKIDQAASFDQARRELERMASRNITIITDRDHRYPAGLKELKDPPAWLFVQGDLGLLQKPCVAVVGTRLPSESGVTASRRCARALVELGVPVVSGLAEGIDGLVHQTVLDLNGKAIAVLGHGINVIFPAATAGIRERIVRDGGLLITEYFPYDQYNREKFVQRNRIQAAISKVVIPVQGAGRSGTAHTVEFAFQLNRVLVGVTEGAPDIIPQNELIEILRQRHCRIFDLQTDIETFQTAIQELLSISNPPIKSAKFESLTRMFSDWLTKYPVSKDELDALLLRLKEIWENKSKDGSQISRF